MTLKKKKTKNKQKTNKKQYQNDKSLIELKIESLKMGEKIEITEYVKPINYGKLEINRARISYQSLTDSNENNLIIKNGQSTNYILGGSGIYGVSLGNQEFMYSYNPNSNSKQQTTQTQQQTQETIDNNNNNNNTETETENDNENEIETDNDNIDNIDHSQQQTFHA